ncbi:hypothetical protein [Micromonospora sp. NPDC007230]|uniref:hypothetical protein n=1 Tax=Micromonospora sp. NPDC007230 TaxID=3364237 RepID=UPI00368F6535
MTDREPTAAERLFVDELCQRVDGFDLWFGQDADGAPRVTVSYLPGDGDRAGTHPVLTYDGRRLRGGWSAVSPAWESEAAPDDLLDSASRHGLRLDHVEPVPAAASAADWLVRETGRRAPAPPGPVRAHVAVLISVLAGIVALLALLFLVCMGPLVIYRLLFPDGPFA